MTRAMKWTVIASILLVCLITVAQQQFSGGQSVTVQNFPATQSVATTQLPGGLDGSGFLKVHEQGTAAVSLAALPSLAAGTAKIGITYPYTSCGTVAFTTALQAMPTASTAITASTTCVLTLQLSNTSAGSLTVNVSDNQGTPVSFLNAVTVLPGETREYSFPNGMKLTSGIKVNASGTGVTYAIEGLQ